MMCLYADRNGLRREKIKQTQDLAATAYYNDSSSSSMPGLELS